MSHICESCARTCHKQHTITPFMGERKKYVPDLSFRLFFFFLYSSDHLFLLFFKIYYSRVHCECGTKPTCKSQTASVTSKERDESSKIDILAHIHASVIEIWDSDIDKLTIGQDLPRLGTKIF